MSDKFCHVFYNFYHCDITYGPFTTIHALQLPQILKKIKGAKTELFPNSLVSNFH